MFISPIKNTPKTNFNGKFLYTPTVRRVLNQSEKSSIIKFENLLEKTEKIDDGLIFKLGIAEKFNMIADNIKKTTEYILTIFNEKTSQEDSFIIEDSQDLYSTKERIEKNKKMVLGVLTDFIEKTYYSPEGKKDEDKIQQKVKDEILKVLEENKD